MCDAVIHDDFISMLVVFYRQLYLDQPAYGPEDRANKMRIRFRILRGFNVDSELCGRDITDLAAPQKLRCYGCDDKEEEAKLQDGSARGAIAFLKRMWNNRKMLLKCNAMLEDLRGRKDPSVLVVKRIKQLEMARPKMLHDQK